MKSRVKPKKNLKDFSRHYFLDVSVNALKHIIRAKNVGERRFWLVMFAMAVFGSGFCVLEVWKAYESSFTKTTILTTYYPYAYTPFPSVTVCEPSRVHSAVLESLHQNASGRPGSYEEALLNMMMILSITRLPLFNDFVKMKKWKAHFGELNKLNISDVLLRAKRPCNEVFDAQCWWRNKFYNCCELFELQKTCYGYCYSFNSDVSEYSKGKSGFYGMYGDKKDFWEDDQGVPRPRRSSGSGPWSGLKFSVRAQNIPYYLDAKPGVLVMIKDPSALPMERAVMVAKGTSAYLRIWGDKVQPTERLIRVTPEKRYCLYPHELYHMGRGYLRLNCMFNCYERVMYHYCGCVPSFNHFLYETDDPYPECNLEGLVCLAEHSSNYININDRDKNYSAELECYCPGDCYSQKYRPNIVVLDETANDDQVTVDVFYQRSKCFLYETDIVFDFMNALVGYGGVCGLFLGASLISGVEFLNFITFRLYEYWINRRHRNKIFHRFIN